MTKQNLANALKKDLGGLATSEGLFKLKARLVSSMNETKSMIADASSPGDLLDSSLDSVLKTCCGLEYKTRALCDWQNSLAGAQCLPFYSRAYKWNKLAFYVYEMLALAVFVVALIFVLLTPKVHHNDYHSDHCDQYEEQIQLAAVPSAPPMDSAIGGAARISRV